MVSETPKRVPQHIPRRDAPHWRAQGWRVGGQGAEPGGPGDTTRSIQARAREQIQGAAAAEAGRDELVEQRRSLWVSGRP